MHEMHSLAIIRLSGRSQITQVTPSGEQLEQVMRRTIELLNGELTSDQIRHMASAFRSVKWESSDVGTIVYLVMDDTASVLRFPSTADEGPSVQIRMDSNTLHDTAWGRTSFGAAFISGKLRVSGLNPLKMTRLISLLKPFLSSYKKAEEEPHAT